MNYRSILINVIEFGSFVLPVVPDSFNVRITILSIYFIGNYYKIQNYYSHIKHNFINKK